MTEEQKRSSGCFILVITFIVSSIVGGLLLPLLQADNYAPGESLHRWFSVVAFVPKKGEHGKKNMSS